MENRPAKPNARDFRRRALRFQKHKVPRKATVSPEQRLLALGMMIVSVALALYALAQYAPN